MTIIIGGLVLETVEGNFFVDKSWLLGNVNIAECRHGEGRCSAVLVGPVFRSDNGRAEH